MYFFQDHKWKVRSGPKKKVPSRKSQAPVFRNKAPKLASLQAFEPTDAGLKPNGQGFKPQAIKFQFQDSVSRVQAHKLRVRGTGNEDK